LKGTAQCTCKESTHSVIANPKCIWAVPRCTHGQGTSTVFHLTVVWNSSRLGTCLSLSFLQCRLDTKQICQHSTDVTLRTLQSVYITCGQFVPHREHHTVLLCGETQDVCCELHTEHTGTLCGQMWGFVETWRTN
jgi:hypothetical protein